MKQCKYCQTKYTDTEKCCPSCGANDASHVCNSCDTVFDTAFCPNCGTEANDPGKTCPICGKHFFSVACPDCGYTTSTGTDKFLQQAMTSFEYMRTNKTTSAPPPPPPPEPEPAPEKSRSGCLTVFLWVFFFPFMLMYKVGKSKRLPLSVKIVIIAVISFGVFVNVYAVATAPTTPVSTQPAVTEPANINEPVS